jgi:hypothetical protein
MRAALAVRTPLSVFLHTAWPWRVQECTDPRRSLAAAAGGPARMGSPAAPGRWGTIRGSSAWRTPAGTSAASVRTATRSVLTRPRSMCPAAAARTPGPIAPVGAAAAGRSRRGAASRRRRGRIAGRGYVGRSGIPRGGRCASSGVAKAVTLYTAWPHRFGIPRTGLRSSTGSTPKKGLGARLPPLLTPAWGSKPGRGRGTPAS